MKQCVGWLVVGAVSVLGAVGCSSDGSDGGGKGGASGASSNAGANNSAGANNGTSGASSSAGANNNAGASGAGDGNAAGASSTGGDPVVKCNALLEAYCGRGADCVSQLGCDAGVTRDAEYANCLSSLQSGLDCSSAVGIGTTYDGCLAGMKAFACSDFGTATVCMAPDFPASCEGAILVTQ